MTDYRNDSNNIIQQIDQQHGKDLNAIFGDGKESRHYMIVAGSRMYGTHTDNSDYDIYGFATPLSIYFNPYQEGLIPEFDEVPIFRNFRAEVVINDKPSEVVIYSLPRFVGLAYENNPNIIETLFCRPENVIHVDYIGYYFRFLNNL